LCLRVDLAILLFRRRQRIAVPELGRFADDHDAWKLGQKTIELSDI
jgi:hypothetical protein